ncbi:MAG: Crp/Fnr family transcriptional regulator [Rhodocyclaceae bacterium]|jgi:CRP-like cAMP-binding protein|nr:Crp/Fnr family transcriptional regulator [Rhodocyclaceae bacterium]
MQNDKLDISQILRRIPLFQELSPEQIGTIAAQSREKRLHKGEMLFQKGDQPRGFYAIVYGQVKLAFPSAAGNEKVVEILGPQQSFGEAVMFMDRPYPVFAESLADTLLLHIARSAVFEMLETDNSFARRMLAGLSVRLHNLVRDVESYSLRSSAQRVIGFLLQRTGSDEDETGDIQIELPTSKQVIASRLNLTPETLSRIFHDLAAAKLITVHGKHVTVHDVRRLREYEP